MDIPLACHTEKREKIEGYKKQFFIKFIKSYEKNKGLAGDELLAKRKFEIFKKSCKKLCDKKIELSNLIKKSKN